MVRQEKVLLVLGFFLSRFLFKTILFAIVLMLIASCGNDLGKVNAITVKSEGPAMTARNIEVLFSDSAKMQARLTSVLLNKYAGQKPYMEFPKGFRVVMYDSIGRIETTITGNYGKQDETSRVMEARGNVIVRNEIKSQQINTEELTWVQNKNLIYSNVKVKITTENKVLYSDGLKANDAFTWYEFVNPHGQMTVKKDSI